MCRVLHRILVRCSYYMNQIDILMNENFIHRNERRNANDANGGELPPTSARANCNALKNILFRHLRSEPDGQIILLNPFSIPKQPPQIHYVIFSIVFTTIHSLALLTRINTSQIAGDLMASINRSLT